MPKRRGYINKSEVLEKLQAGRAGAVQVCTQAKIGSKEYQLAGHVRQAIDDLAGKLTGNPEFFWTRPATTPPRDQVSRRGQERSDVDGNQ